MVLIYTTICWRRNRPFVAQNQRLVLHRTTISMLRRWTSSGVPVIRISIWQIPTSWLVSLWTAISSLCSPMKSDDDHRYLKWDTSVAVSQSSYLSNSCTNNRNSDNETPTIVGEFSISPPDKVPNRPSTSSGSKPRFWAMRRIQMGGSSGLGSLSLEITDGLIKVRLTDTMWFQLTSIRCGRCRRHPHQFEQCCQLGSMQWLLVVNEWMSATSQSL